ncbi:MvaI/BcnI restriction endonuclease family protein [candidate division WOR-3 bacterium]|nr:MvaI/BcnI restriction endonuclease family protein [candidate division WOR-3 bacterium]
MKMFTKEQLISTIGEIFRQGWHRSVKKTYNARNDGAVGNTLENLLGIEENNLPIPNAQDWELKGQRTKTSSLVTLKHIEPSPRGAKIVPGLLVPYYGWPHAKAGTIYPSTEMSFRSTTGAREYTSRGFRIIVDRKRRKLRLVFDPAKADTSDRQIAEWLASVQSRVGFAPLNPEPYWAFEDLKYKIGSKIMNCFYVVADTKVEKNHEFFRYRKLLLLSGFSFERFRSCVENGSILVDFDARTGHNHGTKFRIRQGHWSDLYTNVEEAI